MISLAEKLTQTQSAPDSSGAAVAVEIEGLVSGYQGSRRVLDGVSLRIHRGERFGIIGPTGAGKSTLLLHLNGILLPQKGTVTIAGIPVNSASLARVRQHLGLVFQNPDDQLFNPTVEEDVAFGPLNQGLSPEAARWRVQDAIKKMNLQGFEKRAPHQLSFGEKRRVALATVLSMKPEIVAFDEPFANLDPSMSEQLVQLIKELEGTAVIVSQAMLPALACCQRIAVLHGAKILAVGPALEIARDRALLRSCGMDFHFFAEIWKDLLGKSSS
jgi:cobalt/nickel transport system ATP-binding protein